MNKTIRCQRAQFQMFLQSNMLEASKVGHTPHYLIEHTNIFTEKKPKVNLRYLF